MLRIPETRSSLILRLRDPEDWEAWNEFAEIYGPALYRFARGRGFQHADAQNLVQEVFAGVTRGVGSWTPDRKRGRFRAWLFRIARNKTINLLTRPRHQSLGTGDTRTLRWIENQPAPTQEDWRALDQEYRRELMSWVVNKVRAGVSEKTWRAFWMTYVEEVPVQEAAARLGMSCGAIYIARSRMLARLNQEAGRFEEEPAGNGKKWA